MFATLLRSWMRRERDVLNGKTCAHYSIAQRASHRAITLKRLQAPRGYGLAAVTVLNRIEEPPDTKTEDTVEGGPAQGMVQKVRVKEEVKDMASDVLSLRESVEAGSVPKAHVADCARTIDLTHGRRR